MAIPKFEKDISYISKLADQPNDNTNSPLSAAQLKERFDAAGNDIKEFINNELVPAISEDIAAAAEGLSGGGQLGEEKIADGAISASKLAVAAVRTEAMADAAVTTAKMADNATIATKIADGAVATAKLAQNAVTRDKLADDAVSANKIFAGAVITQKIANGAVTTDKIVDGAVTRTKLANDALYSPIIEKTSDFQIAASDVGATYSLLAPAAGTGKIVATLSAEVAAQLPSGATFAFYWLQGKEMELNFNNVRVAIEGETTFKNAFNNGRTITVKINELFSTVAIQLVMKNPTYGDVWAVIGNAEVIS